MNLPTRAATHITESESRKVLGLKAPKPWLIRDLTERDYGVDAYIEMCSEANEVTGDFFLAQLKGTDKAIDWITDAPPPKPRYFIFSGTKIATVNYWMRLGVPVFLMVVECNTNRIFFANIKEQVRSRYDECLTQGTFGFKMIESAELGPPGGNVVFRCEYNLEKRFPEFQSAAVTLLSSQQRFLAFIEAKSDLDDHMEVDPEDEIHFVHIYETCRFVACWVGIGWNIPLLDQLYRDDEDAFHGGHQTLHNRTFNRVLPQLGAMIPILLRDLLNLVMDTERRYWETHHPFVSRVCSSFWHNQPHYPAIFPNPAP